MAVPTDVTDLSEVAASNSPAGTEAIGTNADNYIRAHAAILRQEVAGDFDDVASATTCAIGAAPTNNVRVTGTTTITGFGTVAAGIVRNVRFADSLTLTHNGTSLILPSAANITTAANDCLRAVSLGSGNWIVTHYQRAAGWQPLTAQLTTLAALTPTDGNIIVGDGSNFVVESGDTARASLGLAIGTNVQAFDAQLADIAGLTPSDGGFIVGDGSNFVLESGATARTSLGIGGAVQQIVEVSTSSYGSTTNNIPLDNTAPQNTEGAEALSQAFTPVSSSSTIYIFADTHLDGSAGSIRVATICNTAVSDSLAAALIQGSSSNVPNSVSLMHSEASGSTSARTYSVRYGANSGTCYVNGNASGALFGGKMRTRLRIIEVL